jgi:hypothetical protein
MKRGSETHYSNPEIIPIDDIDPAFGPLVPICRELRIDAGPIDAVFINKSGQLTIVECKLWKNPQARREVVAQTLDYVSALSGLTYADLQRQVAAAVGEQGNIPSDLVRKHDGSGLKEPAFVDAVSRSLIDGRFMLLLAGDGIREGVQSLTELVNRSATKAFTFALIEIAVYQFGKNRIAIQPRVLAETEVVTRQMTIVNMRGDADSVVIEDVADQPEMETDEAQGSRARWKAWWQPVLKMKFDDPEQEAPSWLITNNIALGTPYPAIHIKAWAMVDGKQMGVYRYRK